MIFRRGCRHGCFVALLVWSTACVTYAQEADPPAPLVSSVSFEGDTPFDELTLSARVRTTANREFLGIGGFRWWLWVYRLGESGKLGSRLGKALTASGEPPAVYDESIVEADVERLEIFLKQEGFRSPSVWFETVPDNTGKWIDVSYHIDTGPPTYVRRVLFDGLEGLSSDVQADLVGKSLIRRQGQATGDNFVALNQRYSEPQLLEERRRILSFLRDEGYAAITRDSIRALVFPQATDSFDVTFRIRTGPVHQFGNVAFAVTGPEQHPRIRADTLVAGAQVPASHSSVPNREHELVTARYTNESKMHSLLLRRSLRFAPGQTYDQSRVLDTKRRLDATGTFSFTNVTATLVRAPDSLSAPLVVHRFDLRTRRRHRIRFETFMLQRSDVLGGADTQLGTGVGVSYRNANLLGGGEAFSVRVSGSVAADSDFKLFTSAQAELVTSLQYPYIISPFRRIERALDLYNAGTRISLSLLTARRDELKLILRGRGNARVRLELQHTPTLTSLVDVLDVSVSNPDTLEQFSEQFLDPLLASIQNDPVQRARIIEDYTQPQVNDAFRYTLRSTDVNPLRRDNGHSYESSVEMGGTLSAAFDRWVFSPSALEGTLPGLPFFSKEGARGRLLYRPYARILADIREYRRFGRNSVFAWKAIGGIAHPIGQADVVPFDRRFFSGGAISVRGWGLGELGPGAASLAQDAASADATTNILGGDVKLEASVEIRTRFFRNVLAAEWFAAAFTDAGNVWFGPRNPGIEPEGGGRTEGRFRLASLYREIGLGSGAGIRVAWEYLIIRFDFGVRVYDPASTAGGFFPNGARPLVHFGIGHAF